MINHLVYLKMKSSLVLLFFIAVKCPVDPDFHIYEICNLVALSAFFFMLYPKTSL